MLVFEKLSFLRRNSPGFVKVSVLNIEDFIKSVDLNRRCFLWMEPGRSSSEDPEVRFLYQSPKTLLNQ